MSDSYMTRALELARGVQGSTSPNPPVGAVVVKDGRVVGEGATQPPGQAHAEIVALRQAGDEAKGAELYVTLEPCSHWGRTPPCVNAIIDAEISTVHVAVTDPNPRVNGSGIQKLKQAEIEVILGEAADDASELIEGHVSLIVAGRPLVVLAMDVPESVRQSLEERTDTKFSQISDGTTQRGIGYEDQTRALQDELKDMARNGIATCLIESDQASAESFLASGLIDKIVSGTCAAPPDGFFVRHRVEAPSPHYVLYPDRHAGSNAQSTTERTCLQES